MPLPSLPAVFVSHGAPTLAAEDGAARRFLAAFGAALGRPRAIAVVSAHWETERVHVLATPSPDTVHDFFGFAPALYALRYPAPGAAALAHDIVTRLEQTGIDARIDAVRGLDHGAWIPLALMYPEADIPVTQISVCPAASPLFHWRLGRALTGLRAAGVLVLGSGALTHNLDDFRLQRHQDATAEPPPYARAFCDWVAARVARGDADALIGWRELAPEAARAHPSPEHFLPLLVALGAGGTSWRGERAHHSFLYGAIGMDCYLFRSCLAH